MSGGWFDPFRRVWGWLSAPYTIGPSAVVVSCVDFASIVSCSASITGTISDSVDLPGSISDTSDFVRGHNVR